MLAILLMAAAGAPAPHIDADREAGEYVEAPRGSAEALYSAVEKMRRIPYFVDSHGAAEKWTEIGPHVIKHGWGDMDNAGRTSMVLVDPVDSRIVYAATASGGLWKSDDRCKTWTPLTEYQQTLTFGAIAIDPFNHQTVYAGTGEAHYSLDSFTGLGLLRSQDGGQNWTVLGTDVFLGQAFARIVPDPSRPGFVYAAATGGLFRSTDAGGTWVKLLQGPVSDLLVDFDHPKSLLATVGSPSGLDRNGLYKSVDAGQHWQKVTNGLPRKGRDLGRLQMGLCRSYPNVVYISMYGSNGTLHGIFRSNDFGDTWTVCPTFPQYAGGQAWYDNYLSVNTTNPNVVFVGGTSTYRTVDGGRSWIDDTRSYSGGPVHPDHHFLTFDPQDSRVAYLCGDGGVFRTPDLGETWESVCNGIRSVQFQSVAAHPWDKEIAFGGTQDNGTQKRVAGSNDWRETFFGDGGTTRVNPQNPSIVYTEYVGLKISKSTDGGEHWAWGVTNGIDFSEGALFYAPYNLDPSHPDTLVAGTQRVWQSTDGAGSWHSISPKLGGMVSAITIAPNNSAVIYAGTNTGRVWVTGDGGGHWINVTPKRAASVNDFAIDPRNARVVYLAQNGWSGTRIWKSTDAGWTWRPIGTGLPEVPVHAIVLSPSHPDTVFAATEVGVFASLDGGLTWRRFGRGLPVVPVYSIVATPGTGYLTIGTHGRGAWRIPIP